MKTFENSYNPNAENPYKDIDSNTEHPKPKIAESIETERELQELTVLTKSVESQLDNEMAELKKVIDQLPKKEKGEIRKKIEKAFVIVSAGFMMFAAAGCSASSHRAAVQIIERSAFGGKTLPEINKAQKNAVAEQERHIRTMAKTCNKATEKAIKDGLNDINKNRYLTLDQRMEKLQEIANKYKLQ